MSGLAVTVPTVGRAAQLPALVARCLEDGAEPVALVVNDPGARDAVHEMKAQARTLTAAARPGAVTCLHRSGSVYASWNAGVRFCAARGADVVAVLNDDLELEPGALWKVRDAFEADPLLAVVGFDYGVPTANRVRVGSLVYVSGSYRHGGVGGFAFAVRADRWAGADEGYRWWYGDDDLLLRTEEAGWRLAIRTGAGVSHQGSASSAGQPWVADAIAEDTERFRARWGAR